MRHRFFYICFILLSFNMSTFSQNIKEKDDINRVLKEFIDNKKAINYCNKLPSFKAIDNNGDSINGIVYILNSDCSFCVVSFLDFYLSLKNTQIHLYALIEEGNIPVVKYYMEKIGIKSYSNLQFIENIDKRIFDGNTEDYSGVVLYYSDNKLKYSILYNSISQ